MMKIQAMVKATAVIMRNTEQVQDVKESKKVHMLSEARSKDNC